MTEADLQAQCNEYLRANGVCFFHLPKGRSNNQKQMNVGGLPDLLIWHNGQHLLIELKTDTGTINDKQREFFAKLESAWFPVMICRSFIEFKLAVSDLVDIF